MADLDHSICSELSKYVEQLTTGGKKELDQGLMKKIKKICKTSDRYVEHTYYLVMTQMEKEHSEVRYSALLVINELFVRSHIFKELLLSNFQQFLELAAEIDPEQPLPPPQKAAKELKMKSLQFVHEWYKNFKDGYKRLTLAYHFLKDCKKVDFSNDEPSTLTQRNRIQEQQQHRENFLQEQVTRTEKEMQDMVPEINRTLSEVDNLFHLLILPVEDVFTESDFKKLKTSSDGNGNEKMCSKLQPTVKRKKQPSDKDAQRLHLSLAESGSAEIEESKSGRENQSINPNTEEKSCLESNLRQHGLTNRKHNLFIEIFPKSTVTIEENEGNITIIENIQDQHRLITSHLLPKIGKWLKVLTKGPGCSNLVKQAINLKQELEARVSKYSELNIVPKKSTPEVKTPDSDDDDDNFEEVQEKEGYEPVIPLHRRKEYGLEPQPSTSTATLSKMSETERQWTINLEERDVRDPTTRYSTLHALCQKLAEKSANKGEPSSSESPPSSQSDSSYVDSNTRKKKLLEQAPRRPYDIDLYHWEEEKLEAPTIVKYDLHKFWTPFEKERNEIQDQEGIASLRRRTIAFAGEFVPVKWTCRAPLPSGKLCPRKDRQKCPFHGFIIPRDEQGNPSNPETQQRIQGQEPSTSQEQTPDWQDPELLRDLEAATGVNLKVPEKRKRLQDKTKSQKASDGKKRKRYPGLTDIKTCEETSRKRLEKKVLNKFAVRRVASTLDSLDKKLFMDKFGNQWNYAFKK